MKTIIYILFTFMSFMNVFAQQSFCDGNRFKNKVFTSYDSTLNVEYGQNYTLNNNLQHLIMDIYFPHNDSVVQRPLIVFVHAGGFFMGTRQDIKNLCTYFALKGFVTATIDYRLIDTPILDSVTVAGAMMQAVSDAKAAIRFFMEDRATNNFCRIDTTNIFIGGGSAGGITASTVAYLDPSDNIPSYVMDMINNTGGFAGNSSTNTNYGTPIKGVINYSGALWRKDWLSAGGPPLYSAHDNMDTIVPCGHGLAKAWQVPVYLDGSCEMQEEATEKGVYNELFIHYSSGHGAYLTTSAFDTVLQKTSDFLYNVICNNSSLSINTPEKSEKGFEIYPNPFSNTTTISFRTDELHYIRIWDVYGKEIKTMNVTGKELVMEKGSMLPGIYFVEVTYLNKKTENKKIIMQ